MIMAIAQSRAVWIVAMGQGRSAALAAVRHISAKATKDAVAQKDISETRLEDDVRLNQEDGQRRQGQGMQADSPPVHEDGEEGNAGGDGGLDGRAGARRTE